MCSVVPGSVYAVLNHYLREKVFEDCEGCVTDVPGQQHHDCVNWSSEDINCRLQILCAAPCLESLLNVDIAIGYAV
ncbi:hypothetical protein G0U57_001797 [Chelydra serpentina]|uniref:Uncharacterized protein n=1 Tax=Chelydra serpentina TaxID=8475 RepID=A0A8T1S0Q0_CHESE|nr:hypothetical protein G0U57_001797 [Chelydra serpentina]